MPSVTAVSYTINKSVKRKKPQINFFRRSSMILILKFFRIFTKLRASAHRVDYIKSISKTGSDLLLSASGLIQNALRHFYSALFIAHEAYEILAYKFADLSVAAKEKLYWLGCRHHRFAHAIRLGRKNRVPAIIFIFLTTTLILSAIHLGVGLEVIVDGRCVGCIYSQGEVETAINTVEQRVSKYLARPYTLNIDVGYNFTTLSDKKSSISTADLENLLYSKVTEISDQYVLMVDNKIIAANPSENDLKTLLNNYLSEQKTDGTLSAEFTQDVRVEKRPISNVNLKSISEISQILKKNLVEAQVYTVQPGDTLDKIAKSNGLSKEDLKSLNPEINENALSAGKTIKVSNSVPLLTIEQVKQVTRSEPVPFETVTEKNDNLYKDDKNVVTEGKKGKLEILEKITYVNGAETGRKVVSKTITEQPVNKLVQIGTKERPKKAATGKYIRPFHGIISSPYGYRGREFHTGVDFAGPIGSPIAASDGGTVKFAGWNGNYGKCIIIRHGNGIETLYGHCSKLLVSVGDKVAKGEIIGKIGSTGRSTGPHVHFEVRINGRYVNPFKYIR